MKKMAWVLVTSLAIAAPAGAQTKAKAAFERMKTLVGEWEGKTSSGNKANVTYALISGDSVVMETLMTEGESSMVTMYHMDGDQLMMTHYCAAGNQPRMRAGNVRADTEQIAFTFLDATNLPSLDTGHMQSMTLTWKDNDHITHVWTWREKSKPDMPEEFQFVRKK